MSAVCDVGLGKTTIPLSTRGRKFAHARACSQQLVADTLIDCGGRLDQRQFCGQCSADNTLILRKQYGQRAFPVVRLQVRGARASCCKSSL